MARGRHQEVKQLNLYRLYDLLSLKQLSAEVSGIVKTLAEVGTRDNTIKRHLMKREQLCWFCDLRAISFIRQTIFVWKWRCIDFCWTAGKRGLPCACQVLPTAMCDCIALTDMRITGLDSFECQRAQITWMRPPIWSINLKKVYLSFFFFFYKLWLILLVERKSLRHFLDKEGLYKVSQQEQTDRF